MQPHEWANHITRSADSDIRTLDSLVRQYQEIKELANQLRLSTHLEDSTNRLIDDVSVKMDGTSRELEFMSIQVTDYYTDLRSALMQ